MNSDGAFILRTSERAALHRCPQRWWWTWREGLKPKATPNALWFGAGIHVALADWYKPGFVRGPDRPTKTWINYVHDEERYLKDAGSLPDETKWVDSRDLGFAMLYGYVEEYGLDPTWDVIATEQTFQVRIKDVERGVDIIFTGTFDGVYRDITDNSLWLMEHKTAGGFPNVGFLELDDQASGYFMAAEIVLRHKGMIGPDEHLNGIMYNYLRKMLPDDRPRDENGMALNKDGSISKRQDTTRFMRYPVWRSVQQRARTREALINEAQLMAMYRNKQLAVTKTTNQDCVWCPHFQLCQLHEADADWKEFEVAMYDRRDPYEDHRLAIKSASWD
jgi:PD-(D/E)XK nuclease superfamily